MGYFLRQSTAVTIKLGPFVDATDGVTAEVALTISQADIRLSKNGGAFAQTNNVAGATHDEAGEYGIPLNATDTDTLGTLKVRVSETGALPVWETFMVLPANVWDSLFGAGRLQVDAVEISGAAAAADAVEANIGNLDATVSSRLATAGYTAPPAAADNADAVWDEARIGHVAAGSFGQGVASVQGNITGSVASVTADVGITQAGADKVWSSAARTLTSFGTLVADIWAAVVDSSGVATLLSRLTAGRATNLDNLDAAVSTRLATAGYTAPPTAAANADAVWDEAIAGHLAVGSTGAALNAAGSAGDPWSTVLPGAYGAGTAGNIVGNNLNAAVSTRATQASVDDLPTNAELTTALDAIPTAVENADALLDRNMATGTDSGSPTVRTPRQALRALRNRGRILAGVLNVYMEDDTTVSWTAAAAQSAGNPVTEIDPASS